MSATAVILTERPIQAWESEGGTLARPAPKATLGARSWILNSSEGDVRAPVAAFGSTSSASAEARQRPGYPKFKNDRGVPEIRIGAREFECIGESPPNDHPHVHIDMGSQDSILCPYCSTRYRMDAALSPSVQAEPADSLFEDAADRDVPIDPPAPNQAAILSTAHLLKENQMFGHQGGEDEATVARKREYLRDAQQRWPFLTPLDASTIKGEAQLVDLVRTRISLPLEQARADVRAWMDGKQF